MESPTVPLAAMVNPEPAAESKVTQNGYIPIEGDTENIHPLKEPPWKMLREILIPFLLAGLGIVCSGIILNIVQFWDVFVEISEIFIMVPALLGLKGNIQMTLASRLSTQANMGRIDDRKELRKIVLGNMALTQVQTVTVGFLAALVAVLAGVIIDKDIVWQHVALLMASCVASASITSFLQGVIVMSVVICSRLCHINPDNVGTPVASALGDTITLIVLAGIAQGLYQTIGVVSLMWISPMVLGIVISILPVWIIIAHRNPYVCDILHKGWTPIIGAMIISSLGGLILQFSVKAFVGLAIFQPVINGVGGNTIALYASRLSTALHYFSQCGQPPPKQVLTGCISPCTLFTNEDDRCPNVLLAVIIPAQLFYVGVIYLVTDGKAQVTPMFCLFYSIACLLQVLILLPISTWLVGFLWARGKDPDQHAIPYLTGLADFLGTALLAAAFYLLFVTGFLKSSIHTLITTTAETVSSVSAR